MTELPIWALEGGVPSPHVNAASVRVARMLGPDGSEISDLRRSYRQHASGAFYSEPDMIKGETLLVDCGLALRVGSRLVPTGDLTSLALADDDEAAGEIAMHVVALFPATTSQELESVLEATIPNAERREELLLTLGAKFDDARSRLIGEIGEEIVVLEAQDQMLQLGHPELVAQVRRVSIGSDALGYDVSAPRTTGSKRLLEVKASTTDRIEFYLTRNEWQTGSHYPDDWFLVYVRVDDAEQRHGQIVGWCGARQLGEHIPADRGTGTWRSVLMQLSASSLEPGLPH